MRKPSPGLVLYSDRGSQYCSGAYQQMLRDEGMVSPMRGGGNGCDNAMGEAVFMTLKAELVWRTVLLSRQHAEPALGRSIDGFNNPRRRLSAPICQSPCAFEAAMSSNTAPHLPGESP